MTYKCRFCDCILPEELVERFQITHKIICEECGHSLYLPGNKIFISFTSELIDLVDNLKDKIKSLNYDPIWYKGKFDLKQTVNDGIKACFSNIENSDFFLILLDKSAGSYYDMKNQIPIIEKEFDCANENDKMIMVLIRDVVYAQVEQYKSQEFFNLSREEIRKNGLAADKEIYDLILKIKNVEFKNIWIEKFNTVDDIIREVKNKWGPHEENPVYTDNLYLIKDINVNSIEEFVRFTGTRKFDLTDLEKRRGALSLTSPIESDLRPDKWIFGFQTQFQPLLADIEGKEWLKERILKLAYGNRGIQRYDLLDAMIAVPPLESVVSPIKEELCERSGKFGLFAKPGMGKSRILLYLSYWWVKTYPDSLVVYIGNPLNLSLKLWEQLQKTINETEQKLLLIIDDIHLIVANKKEEQRWVVVKRIIHSSSLETYALLTAFTDIEKTRFEKTKGTLKQKYEILKTKILPNDRTLPNLNDTWAYWREFLWEWIYWAAKIVLDPEIFSFWQKKFNKITKEQIISRYKSPWALVITLGFLERALERFQEDYKQFYFHQLLYGFIALLFLKTKESGISQTQLLGFLKRFIGEDEMDENWKKDVPNIIESLINPPRRLLPPLQTRIVSGKMLRTQLIIDFYHREWAISVCNKLFEDSTSELHGIIHKLFEKSMPHIYGIWKELSAYSSELTNFIEWFIECVEIELKENGKYNVISLDLGNNNLSFTPRSLSGLNKLEILYLNNNILKDLPDSIENLTQLKELNLDNNELVSLPESICNLCNLEKLYLEHNYLDSLPNNINNLSELRILKLKANNLQELPHKLGKLQNLEDLWVNENNLEKVPKVISQLYNLKTLHLAFNNLNNLPKNLEKLHNLENLDLSNNNFQEIPVCLSKLNNLENLGLGYNEIKKLPKKFSKLKKLKELFLALNNLDHLPKNFGFLTNLVNLDLGANVLKKLPESFGNLVNLKTLEMYDNHLSNLPESFGNLKSLEKLNLANNELFYLPKSFKNLTNLEELKLQNNKFSSLPESILELRDLKKIYLSGNPPISFPETSRNIDLFKKKITDKQFLNFAYGGSNKISLSEMFKEVVPQIFKPHKAKNFRGLVQFIINGDKPQAIYIDKGKMEIKSERGVNPYVTFQMSKGLFLAIIRGMVNPREAYSTGRVKVDNKTGIFKVMKIFEFIAIPRIVREMERKHGVKYSNENISLYEVFRNFKKIFIPEKAKRWEGVIQFDIPEEPYAIIIKNGSIEIKQMQSISPKLTISINKEDMIDLATGFLHPAVAFISNILKGDDNTLLHKIARMFNFDDFRYKFIQKSQT